ncbi:MAG TPA: FAD:protein FMN transferase [Anaerolineae bacterium]|nr:FAD:protein FMN transferase [Anaerolineae bacterium]
MLTTHHHTFRAMGCTINLWLETDNNNLFPLLWHEAENIFRHDEQCLSRFKEDSELSRLNRNNGRFHPVSPTLWNLLHTALQLAHTTNGWFDPTLLPALEAIGYNQSFAHIGTHGHTQAPAHTPTLGQWAAIDTRLTPTQYQVRLPPHTQLDFGGIGKGYTAQRAIDFLSRYGPCLIDAGGDLIAGPPPADKIGWPVTIAAPTPADTPPRHILPISLAHSTLATSAIDYRAWYHNNHPVHHIINPHTGQPAQTDLLSVSILAADGAQAEGWATACLAAGHNQAYQLTQQHHQAALFYDRHDHITITPLLNQIRPQ